MPAGPGRPEPRAGEAGGGPRRARGPRAAARPRVSAPRRRAAWAGASRGGSPFPPIADYAFLSDCHTGALVAPDGSVEWLCLPRFDGPSIFGALLDRSAGSFRLAPYGVEVPAGRRYEPGTNVLETTWMTPTGWLVVRDALTIGDWHGSARARTPARRPTTTPTTCWCARSSACRARCRSS